VIRLLIAEDHPAMRAGLEDLLSSAEDIEIVGAAEDGEQAIALAADQHPDVLLIDLAMPKVDGIEAIGKILEARPELPIVVLTAFSERERILAALDAGAVGYLLKDAEPDQLFAGIRAAARGESPLAPKAAQAVLEDRAEQRSVELSNREQEVLALVAEGLPNKLIARRLEISEKTVKAHLTRVFEQIGVSDRTQAALWAQRHGIGAPSADG